MIGRTVSHYRILSPLGQGGMGVVYLAEDERLGRQVALKFLPPTWSQERMALERFRVEARAASSLSHPGICAIYDIGEDGQTPFIVMEALKGETLRERIGKGPLKVADVLDIGIQLADALEAAHAQSIVHRDIKPANIFIGDKNRVKVLDFGLAKLTTAPSMLSSGADTTSPATRRAPENQMTIPGTALGTVSYMSPEQARGEDIDSRTDLFSMGAVLYEMVTGHQAFGGSTTAVVYDAILNRAPRQIAHLNPVAPPRLEAVIATALEKDRELRYQHASDLQAELKRIRRDLDSASLVASQPGLSAARQSAPALAKTEVRSAVVPPRRSLDRAATVIAVLAAIAAAVWIWRGQSTPPVQDVTETPPAIERAAPPAETLGQTAAVAPPVATESTPAPRTAAPVERSRPTTSEEQRPQRPLPSPPASAATAAPVITLPAPPAAANPTPSTSQPPLAANNATENPPAVPVTPPAPAAIPAPPPVSTVAAPPPERTATPIEPAAAAPQPAAAPAETDEAAIRRVIRSYAQAIETKNIDLYRSLRPGLPPAAEAAVRNSFRQVGSQEVVIRVETLTVDGRTATARISRQDTLVTGGRRQTQSSTGTLRFEKTAAGWIIAE